jgi:glycosyltransferase involved in cell wall biosynthesis
VKVALVCDWFHPRIGGIELHLQDLALRLRAAGHDAVVITPTPGEDVVNGIRIVRVNAPLAPHFGFLATPGGVRAVGDALARERVDVAHCHVSIVSPAALGGAAEAVRRRIPAVVSFHSMVPQTRLLAAATARVLGTKRWPVRFAAVTGVIARQVEPIAPTGSMSILSNGMDTDFWRRSNPPRQETGTLELISVLRLNPKKLPVALPLMMGRLARVNRQIERVRLRIVGGGPQRRLMEVTIAKLGMRDRIELLGVRTREEIRSLLAESDIFVLPTRRESFGLAALEARCVGLPVVAMRASGVSEFIKHDESGLLADSHEEMANHVATLATDPERRRRIAEHNRAVGPGYDWSTVLADHVSIYRGAIALRDSVPAENAT